MAVFVDVHDNRPLPTEQEVSGAGSDDDRDAEINVVRHEDQHQEVADGDLDHVKKSLQEMGPAQETGPEETMHTRKNNVRWSLRLAQFKMIYLNFNFCLLSFSCIISER